MTNLIQDFVDDEVKRGQDVLKEYWGSERQIYQDLDHELKLKDRHLEVLSDSANIHDFIKGTWEEENLQPFPEEPDVKTSTKEEVMKYLDFQKQELSKQVERVFTPMVSIDITTVNDDADVYQFVESLVTKFKDVFTEKTCMENVERITIMQPPSLYMGVEGFRLNLQIHTLVYRHKKEG